jgi:hypothetical protein
LHGIHGERANRVRHQGIIGHSGAAPGEKERGGIRGNPAF